MEVDMFTIAIATAAICLLIFWSKIHGGSNVDLPPGPRGLSTLMAQWKAMKNWSYHLLMSSWAHKYGSVIGLKAAGKKMVIVNDAELAWQIYVTGPHSHTMVHRGETFVGKYVFYGDKGAYFTTFDDIGRQKFNLIKSYFDISKDTGIMDENGFDQELERLCQELKRHNGRDAPLHDMITSSLKNLMCMIVTGERPGASTDREKLYSFDKHLNRLVSAEVRTALEMLPSLRYFPGIFRKLWQEIQKTQKVAENHAFYSKKSSYLPGNVRGLTDHLISCQDRPQYGWLDDEHICSLLLTVFTCANVTTTGYLLALFLTLLHHPWAMAEIQRELDQKVGRQRKPTVADRSQMPYSQAAILEIMRYASNLPLTSARVATRDMHFEDFAVSVPAGSAVLINAWHIHHDGRLFKDPWEFRPERFLDRRGQLLPPTSPERKAVYGMGIGERNCPAADYANAKMFLYMTTILQQCDLSEPDNKDHFPSCDPRHYIPGAILQPRSFSCKVRTRSSS